MNFSEKMNYLPAWWRKIFRILDTRMFHRGAEKIIIWLWFETSFETFDHFGTARLPFSVYNGRKSCPDPLLCDEPDTVTFG